MLLQNHCCYESMVHRNQDKMGRDIVTTINYYDDPGDGSPPMPVYVGR
jgi:hypothetical protein